MTTTERILNLGFRRVSHGVDMLVNLIADVAREVNFPAALAGLGLFLFLRFS